MYFTILKAELEILPYLGDFQRYNVNLCVSDLFDCLDIRYFIPSPRKTTVSYKTNYWTVRFLQEDFHVSFQIFLEHIPPPLQMTSSALETNRCFFIHLGVAINIHPYALQTAFRLRARQINAMQSSSSSDGIQESTALAKELLSSVLLPADLVDANSLMYLWPVEFFNSRICIISGSFNNPIISVFQSTDVSYKCYRFVHSAILIFKK